MSIIADALKRLQAQSEDPPPKPREELASRPTFNKGEGFGRHRKDSPFGFLMVMVGMTIILGGFAVGAFWIGGHLDFGLVTDTQARIQERRALPIPPPLPEEAAPLEYSSETLAATVEEPIQLSKIPKTPQSNDQPRAPQSVSNDSSATSVLDQLEEMIPQLSQMETDDSLSTDVTTPTSEDLQGLSGTRDQPSPNDEDLTGPLLSESNEPSSSIASPEHSELTPEHLAADTDLSDESEDPDLLAMSLDEEMIETEEFVQTTETVIDPTQGSTDLSALKSRLEAMDPSSQSPALLQPSPANRLRHAQQLIQTGKYEDAVTLLSPLFQDPPVKWQPWFWMGTALLGQGDMEQADQFFLSGLARNDKVPQLWIQRALVAQQRGDFQMAIHELRQAESLESDLPHIHLNMGYAYEQLGNDRMANQYYGKFLKFSEGNPRFFSTRKKLFARLTQQPSVEKAPPPTPNSALNP